jgi:early secretory antigenic target protein ESAT-6
MSSSFQVDTERIHAASGDITRISADIETQVGAMLGKLNALQDAWKGSASDRFQVVVNDWKGTQLQVRHSLDDISKALAQAGTQYADAEQANTSMFS